MSYPEENKDNNVPPHGHYQRQSPEDIRQKFTPEDVMFLKKMRLEAAMNRGYPLALISAGLTVLAVGRFLPKVQRWQKWMLAGTAGIFGNIAGKASYVPVMLHKAQTDLPPESTLRRMAEARANGTNVLSILNPANVKVDDEVKFGLEEDAPGGSKDDKKFVSYRDLRDHNRHMEGSKLQSKFARQSQIPQNSDELDSLGDNDNKSTDTGYTPQEMGKVKYNKYGDQIVE